MVRPVADRTVCYNNILVNDQDHPNEPAFCKEGILVPQLFFVNLPDHPGKKSPPCRIVDDNFVLQWFGSSSSSRGKGFLEARLSVLEMFLIIQMGYPAVCNVDERICQRFTFFHKYFWTDLF